MKFKLLTLTLLFSFQLSAQECLPGWSYFSELSIDNSAGTALSDYTVRMEVNTGALVSAGKLNADGSDLRFLDSDCNLYHYWMDSLATSSNNVIWVKIPNIPAAGNMTIYAYYGNTDAEAYANGDSTFVFFDDFESGVVDLNKWEPIGGYATLEVIDGALNYASDGMNPGPRFKFVRTAMAFSEPMIFDFQAQVSNSNGFGFSSADVALDRILFRQSVFGFDTLNQVAFLQDTTDNGYQVEGFYPLIRFPRDEMTNGTIAAGINGNNHFQSNYFANTDIGSVSTTPYELIQIEMTGFHFILSSFLQPHTIFLEYLRVRKPALNPPSVAIGPEMENPLAIAVLEKIPAGAISVYPNPSSGFLNIDYQLEEPVELYIYNSLGQLVGTDLRLIQSPGVHQLELNNLSPGIYQVNFRKRSDQALIYSEKIVIQK
ncbi:MAG: DUF2341 domain-containing protein [Saprospiraceae bacterium]|nr:DUF2341 domain-containing protein [Saprospiraceae bacterium]